MKKILFLFLFPIYLSSSAQMSIDLNQDTIFQCMAYDTLLGTQLTILNAVEPLNYTWYSTIHSFYGPPEETYPASAALNDTTLATPTFTNVITSSIITFHLRVEDALGNTATDSTVVVTSQHIGNHLFVTFYLAPGDSVRFEAPYFLFSNYPPNSYVWSPTHGLSDPYDPYPWASPDTATVYSVMLTDKWGCISNATPYTVYPMGTTSVTEKSKVAPDFRLYPNPVAQGGTINLLPDIQEEVSISIFDLQGKLVQKGRFDRNTYELDPALAKGAYVCYLKLLKTNNQNYIIARKLIIQ